MSYNRQMAALLAIFALGCAAIGYQVGYDRAERAAKASK